MNETQKFALMAIKSILSVAKSSSTIEDFKKVKEEVVNNKTKDNVLIMIRQFNPDFFRTGRFEKFYNYQNEIENFIEKNHNDNDVGIKALAYLSNDLT